MHHPTPLQLAEDLHTKRGFVWLDSLSPQVTFPSKPREEGLSILAAEPDLVLEGGPHDWPLLEKELKRRQQKFSTPHHQVVSIPPDNRELTTDNCHREAMTGAAIGFFRYDGSFCFGFYETLYSHQTTRESSYWLTPLPTIPFQRATKSAPSSRLHFTSDITAATFCEQIKSAQAEIAAGNIYQVCLAHRFTAACQTDPWPLYLALRQKSPAPFAAYLNLGKDTVLSSSPECFLKMKGSHILTRPIKGTRPRGKTAQEDALLANELQRSPKENAELIMITDLLRNDLSRVCNYGTVRTPQLLALEVHPHVFHLVSTIEGQLKKNTSHVEALAACFPGGSISGAPKKKAMEIIARLETAPRGLFTGAIGYFSFDGRSEFNIAIRTLIIADGTASFHVGAGITCDSIPEEEWEETLHKAAGILAAAG